MTTPDLSTLIMMCGLPGSGKTTTAKRLQVLLDGILIRSCDIYQDLGIVVPDWVRRTKGFTINTEEYDRLRNQAYRIMADQVDKMLTSSFPCVIVDFAHPDFAKRSLLYELCLRHDATALVVVCHCDDIKEVHRRIAARKGSETEPEHEASDLSVYNDIQRRWQDPVFDRLPDGSKPTILTVDTLSGAVKPLHAYNSEIAKRIAAAFSDPR